MSGDIIQLNPEVFQSELKNLVKNSIEETLNAMLDEEAKKLVNAERYAREEERNGYRAGHYDRKFTTTAGDVNLRMPKLKGVAFETAIIERYKRRETSIEEALIEMYLAGVSVRRVEDITEALWGTKVSPGTISNLNKKAYEHIEAWRNRPLKEEYGEVKTMLQAANIWYMPLKGIILKQYYPNSCMREMADHDILFDANRAKDVKSIMESLGFTSKHFGASNHDCYYKAPCLNFEMHRALFGTSHDEKLYEYYRNVEERLLGSGCEKHFSPEDFYLYMISHEYKHYSGGGTGLRSLLDVYVYLKSETLDMAYIAAEAEKLGLREFEEEQRSLAFHLFGDGKLTKADQEMLDYILSSGTYGTIQHHVENKMRKKSWNRIQYALNRFFVPVSKKNKDYAAYATQYPFFYHCKVFLPLLPFYRTFRAMKSGSFNAEARAIKNAKR